jgi:hypothetical protein
MAPAGAPKIERASKDCSMAFLTPPVNGESRALTLRRNAKPKNTFLMRS